MQDLFYNPQQKTGWFYTVLKKRQKALTTTERATFKQKNRLNGNIKRDKYTTKGIQKDNNNKMEDDKATDNIDQMPVKYSQEDAIKDIAFLRSCKLNEANMPIIREKLKLTVEERLKMVNEDKTNLLEQFPYFFAEPKLVVYHCTVQFMD